ncbi:transcription repressor OFP2-like [Mangifera indica]|uniref:transcription repressor OFP2-like n=1 Tax=Mangifera indica TaxID=29780 RepID=UPI001CFA5012|nr:transcription repressor OFP2-like [Mangifera indica]
MGKHRFRFSDMIPNAWFYKLKDMSKTRTSHFSSHPNNKKILPKSNSTSQNPHISFPRYSYYFTTQPIKPEKLYNSPVKSKASDTHFPDPSTKKYTKRKTIYKPSPKHFSSNNVSTYCASHYFKSPDDSCISSAESSNEANYFPENDSEDDSFCHCELTSSTTDIIIDPNEKKFLSRKVKKLNGFDTISEMELPPILTKPPNANHHFPVKIVEEESVRTQKEHRNKAAVIRKLWSSNSPGMKLRAKANSPRIGSKKLQAACSRKSISRHMGYSESFVVVKSSVDPQRDFKDSMVEMIVENNLQNSKDLEDLLACYLTLNSKEYQDVIVKAFEEIWFDMTNLRL